MSHELMEVLEHRELMTPDFTELKQKPWHFVFVYGTLKKDFNNHYLLSESVYIGKGITLAGTFKMLRTGSSYGFPIVFDGERSTASGRITGEIYAVKPEVVAHMDELESNGIMYNRKQVRVEHRTDKGVKFQNCFMYVGSPEYWNNTDTLDECPRITDKYNGVREEDIYVFTN